MANGPPGTYPGNTVSSPMCDMALPNEPCESLDGDNGVDPSVPKANSLRYRFWLTLTFTCIALALASTDIHIASLPAMSRSWLTMLISLPVMCWGGLPLMSRCTRSLFSAKPDLWTLLGLGAATAFIVSATVTINPAELPLLTIAPYPSGFGFQASDLLISLSLMLLILETDGALFGTGPITELQRRMPARALRIRADSTEASIHLAQLRVGDVLIVRRGWRIPADGIVIDGASRVDESGASGNTTHVRKFIGDSVVAGSVNLGDPLTIEATRVGPQTRVSRIMNLLTHARRIDALARNAPERYPAHFVAIMVCLALAVFVLRHHFAPELAQCWIAVPISILISTIPCAFGIATPTSISVAFRESITVGAVFHNAKAATTWARADVLLIGKTALLSGVRPRFWRTIACGELTETFVLQLAATLEQGSSHPIAVCIVDAARRQNLALERPDSLQTLEGLGVRGTLLGHRLALGSARLMMRDGIDIEPLRNDADAMRTRGACVMYFCVDGVLAGLVAVIENPSPDARDGVIELKRSGLRVVLATGDCHVTAWAFAKKHGIEAFYGDLAPLDKQALVTRLQSEGAIVAMAGDDVTDATCLRAADVGIALDLGHASEGSSADVTLLRSDLQGLIGARELARLTRLRAHQNLAIVALYTIIFVPLIASALLPFSGTGMLMTPTLTAMSAVLVVCAVIVNSVRYGNNGMRNAVKTSFSGTSYD